MSSEFRFENVRLMLADSNPQVRHGMKSALFYHGFREILDASNYAQVLDAVTRNVVDVVVWDVELSGGDICDMIHQIRHHKIGNNPFLVIYALIGSPTEALVRRVVDSGADDVIIKPVSPDTLVERLKTVARQRKPFVVTHDYIGPDRRKNIRSEAQRTPLLDVPNPLRSKAVANSDSASLQRLVDAAAARINQQKMERYAVQIGYLVNLIGPALEAKQHDAQLVANLQRLSYIGEDLSYRMRGTQYAHVSELALSLIGVADRIREGLDQEEIENVESMVDHRDAELLPKIALAFARAFSPEQNTVEAARAISQSVQSFVRRQSA